MTDVSLASAIDRGLASVASTVDGVMARVHIGPNLRNPSASLRDDEEWPDLAETVAAYDRPEHYSDSRTFFAEPGPVTPRLTEVRRFGSEGRVVDARWESCAPFLKGREGEAVSRGDDAAARLFLHREPARAAVVLIHGYLGGSYLFEEQVWPVRRLFRRGVDVALLTLPFHGLRARRGPRGSPGFPSADPRVTVEGIRKALFELRALMRLFHERQTLRVGAMGMSLGGYLTALLATLEPRLAFSVPVVPLADLTEFARGHVLDPESIAAVQASHAARARVNRVISPLVRPSLVAPERVVVVGAALDRIAPPSHAEALAAHFGAQLEMLPGGHVLQLGRPASLRAVERLVDQSRDG